MTAKNAINSKLEKIENKIKKNKIESYL